MSSANNTGLNELDMFGRSLCTIQITVASKPNLVVHHMQLIF